MKAALKKLLIRLKTAPCIGKPVRFAIAIYRIPRSRVQLISVLETLPGLGSNYRDQLLKLESAYRDQLPKLESAYRDQLPVLLETISKLNQRQHEIDRDLPISLRKVRQDMGSFLSAEREKIAVLFANVDYLLKRVEFVRRELMFEMRYGANKIHPNGDALEVHTRVIAANKLAAGRASQLRLNLGCGHAPLDGYLNIDRRELPGVDIVAEAGNLPFKPGEVDEIVSAHLLEHFPQEQLRRQLLPYWKSLLKPGGLFRAVVPDAEAMIREYSAGRYPYEYMREVFYGAQDYDGDFHHNMFIPSNMATLLAEAGFVDEKVIEAGRRNGLCFEFEMAARCPT